MQIVSFTTFTTGVDILFGFVLGADCFLREILLAGGNSTSLFLLFLFTGSGDTIAIAAIGEDVTGEDDAAGEVMGEAAGENETDAGAGAVADGGVVGVVGTGSGLGSGDWRTRDTSGEGWYVAVGMLLAVRGSGLWDRQAGKRFGLPRRRFWPIGFDLT